MPDNLARYYRESGDLIRAIRANFDSGATLVIRPAGTPLISTRITGSFRRAGLYLEVREQFNWNSGLGRVDKDYKYEFLYNGADLLRLENHGGKPEHAHFPNRFLSHNGQHFEVDRWPEELLDIDFPKVFVYFGIIERNGHALLEPFKSARPRSRFGT